LSDLQMDDVGRFKGRHGMLVFVFAVAELVIELCTLKKTETEKTTEGF
jgi:hypothetical protein